MKILNKIRIVSYIRMVALLSVVLNIFGAQPDPLPVQRLGAFPFFDVGKLAQIRQCVCDLKNDVLVDFEQIELQIAFLVIIDELIVSIVDQLDSKVDNIISQIDTPLCSSVPIFAPLTITTSGSYCLANDIVGDITIAVSDVHLNLNGHQISGMITVNNALQNITVGNGFIQPTGTDGIDVNTGCTGVSFFNIEISNAVVGISADSAADIHLLEISVANGSSFGLQLINCSGEISKCFILNNASDGINCSGTGSSLILQDSISIGNNVGISLAEGVFDCFNCSAISNLNEGIVTNGPTAISVYKDCYSASNGLTGYSIGSGSLVADNCIAFSNQAQGYLFQGGTNIRISNCTASENIATGFLVNNFQFPNTMLNVSGIINNCVSVRNGNVGFSCYTSPFLPDNAFVSNYAEGNFPFNYGVDITIVNPNGTQVITNKPPYYWVKKLDSTALYWRNIDADAT